MDDSLEPGPSHWIGKWIDYSEKYGLGYLLCNGCVGVIFNDGSKIVATPKFECASLPQSPLQYPDDMLLVGL